VSSVDIVDVVILLGIERDTLNLILYNTVGAVNRMWYFTVQYSEL
jgi:hypothetical protein